MAFIFILTSKLLLSEIKVGFHSILILFFLKFSLFIISFKSSVTRIMTSYRSYFSTVFYIKFPEIIRVIKVISIAIRNTCFRNIYFFLTCSGIHNRYIIFKALSLSRTLVRASTSNIKHSSAYFSTDDFPLVTPNIPWWNSLISGIKEIHDCPYMPFYSRSLKQILL